MGLWYILQAINVKNDYGKRVFSSLQADIIWFHLFSPDQVGKVIGQLGLPAGEYQDLRKKTFRKLEDVVCSLVKLDLRQNVLSPKTAIKRLARFWEQDDFPLKSRIKDIFIGQQSNAPKKEFRGAKKLQQIARRYSKPWVYLKKNKRPSKPRKPRGVSDNADERVKNLIKKIDRENYERSKLVSIICEENLARYLLRKLEEETDDNIFAREDK